MPAPSATSSLQWFQCLFDSSKNMTEIWVCVGSERSHKRDYVVPLLRLLPPEGNNYVMEAGQHYTFKVWVRFGEAKIEEAQA